ncbi:MAG: glycosyltransferase [Marmoricola sp.]
MVVAEAMASGTPFVITSAGAMQEVAGPDHPWIAAPEDSAALASVISELLHRPKEAANHAALARTRWEEMYSPQAGLSRLGDLLTQLGEHP